MLSNKRGLVRQILILIVISLVVALGSDYVKVKADSNKYKFTWKNWENMGKFDTKSGAAKIMLLNNKTKSYVKNMGKAYFDFESDNNKLGKDKDQGIYVIYAAKLITKNQGKKGKTETNTNASIHSTSKTSLYRSVGVTVTSSKVKNYDLKDYFKSKKIGSIYTVGRWYEYDNSNGWKAKTKYKATNPTIHTVTQTKDRPSGYKGYWTYKAYVIPWKHFKTMCDMNKINLYEKASKDKPIYVHSIMQKLSWGNVVGGDDYHMRYSVSSMNLSGYKEALKSYFNHKLYLPDLSAKVYVDSFFDNGKKVTKINSTNYSFDVESRFGTKFRMKTVKSYESSSIGADAAEKNRWLKLMRTYNGSYIYDIQEVTSRSASQYRTDGKRIVSHTGNGHTDSKFVKAYSNISSATKPWDAYSAYISRIEAKYHKVDRLCKYYQVLYKTGDVPLHITVKAHLIDGNKDVDTSGSVPVFTNVTDLKELDASYTVPYGQKYTVSSVQSSNTGSTIIKIPSEYTGSKGKGCNLVKVDNSHKSGKITLYDSNKDQCYDVDKTLQGFTNARDANATYESDLSKFYRLSATATNDITIHVFYLKYKAPQSQIFIKHVNINNGETYIENKAIGENPIKRTDNKNKTIIQFHDSSKNKSYRKGNTYYVYIPDKIKDNKVGKDVYPVKIKFEGNNNKGKSLTASYSVNKDGSFVGGSLDNGKFKPNYVSGKDNSNYPQKYSDFKIALRSKKFTHYEAVGNNSTKGTTVTIYYSSTAPNVNIKYRKDTWDGDSISSLPDYTLPGKIQINTELATAYKKNAKTALAVKKLADKFVDNYYVTSLWVGNGGQDPTVYTEYKGKGILGGTEYNKWWEDAFTGTTVTGDVDYGELNLYFVYTCIEVESDSPWIKYVDRNDVDDPLYEMDTEESVATGTDYTFPEKRIPGEYDDKILVDWKITINGEDSVYGDDIYTKKDGVTLAKATNPYADPDTLIKEILATVIKMKESNATLWLVYDEDIEPPTVTEIPPETEVFEKQFEQVSGSEVSALIHDEVPLNEEYEYDLQSDSSGIPTSDYLYTEAMAKKYQTAFQYQSTTGGYEYCIRFYYTGDDGLESIDVPVTRMYEYRAVNSLDIMKADHTLIKNISLGENSDRDGKENEQDTVYYDIPDIKVTYQNNHGVVTYPSVLGDTDLINAISAKIGLTATKIVKDETGYGIGVRIADTLTDEQITALEELAETVYGNYTSSSDTLTADVYKEGSDVPVTVTFLDATRMSDFYAIQTDEEVERGEATDDIDDNEDLSEEDDEDVIKDTNNSLAEENFLYKRVSDEILNHGIRIPDELSNGEKVTAATTKYVRAISLTEGSSSIKNAGSAEYNVPTTCNNVWIHTPVVSTATTYINTEGDDADSPSILQAIELEQTETNVSLGKSFTVSWSVSGSHKDALGYQTRDYSKYVDKITIVCPFEVKYNNGYYDKGEEIVVFDRAEAKENYDVNKHLTKAKLEVPLWTPTGTFNVQVRVYALNAVTDAQKSSREDNANTLMKNYVAVGSDSVVIHGNVYGFQVYDISDYPTWESVFRKDNSLDLTGRTYTVGTRTIEGEENGHSSRATLPIIKGSHPTIDSAGPLNRGYAFRYRLSTTGSMSDLDDRINIEPTFYYVSRDGSGMQEVDLYYSQTIGSRRSYLVKVGSVLDKGNKHYIHTGDKYLGIPESELSLTSTLSGVSLASLKAQKKSVYSYGDIKLPSALRTFAGKDKSIYTLTGNTGKGSNKPYASESTIKKCMQRWYGEYYLPSDVHAVPKGFDVASYGSTGSVDFEESFWLKDGYIVVNFEIKTANGGREELNYNPGIKGTVNMWKREGYQINRSDSTGAAFVFHEGDVVLYDTNNAAANDYDSSGTH